MDIVSVELANCKAKVSELEAKVAAYSGQVRALQHFADRVLTLMALPLPSTLDDKALTQITARLEERLAAVSKPKP